MLYLCCAPLLYTTNYDNLWQILYHRTLTKWGTSGISRTWNGMKISQALWAGKGELENPLVSRIVRASPDGIVIVRNPIYQAFPRPSSILCTAFRRFSLCHSSRFPKSGRRHRQLSSPCLKLLQCRGLRASCIKNGDPRQSWLFPRLMRQLLSSCVSLSSPFLSWHRAWHFGNAYFTELLRGGDRRING